MDQSAIALTIYNMLSLVDEAQDKATLRTHALAKTFAGTTPPMTDEAFDAAVTEMVTRGYITDDGNLDMVDTERRRILARDLTGDGWDNWMVGDPHTNGGATVTIAEATS